MTNATSLPQYIVPSNKFYPPQIDLSQSLLRTNLLNTQLAGTNHTKKAIIVEAQAGQGKTTLAYQYLEHNKIQYVWYQVGPEDSDPVYLLSALLANLCSNVPDFQSPQLATILSEGSVGPLDLGRCTNILLKDLDNHLRDDLFIVFDDLHFIEFGALTNSLLENLVDTSPPKIHFLLLSRQPLDIKSKIIRNGSQIVYLNTSDLALNNNDIEKLYNTILQKEISSQDAIKVQTLTNGWIMGIILASHPMASKTKDWNQLNQVSLFSSNQSGHMLDYFQDEIFDLIPTNLHTSFLKLSFLQNIPTNLASQITGIGDFGVVLTVRARENYFIYNLDAENQVFRFHHFFQEFLQQKAREQISQEEIAQIYSAEAKYYLDLEMTEKALTCYRNAGEFAKMEEILKEYGMGLIAQNRTFTILTQLQTIPDETLFKYSWLTLYSGLLRVDYVPQTTLKFWDRSRAQFIRSGEEIGELIALSQTIYYHFVVSGKYIEGATLLSRTETLLKKNQDELPAAILVMAARNLASGFCFFNGNMEKAGYYIQIASRIAARNDIRNFIASTRFIQGYIELLSGNKAKYLREAEVCFSLFNDPLVGESNRLTMRVMNLCYLSMVGDHKNFSNQQLTLQQSIDSTVVDQTVAAPYMYVWASSNLYALGKTDSALALLEKGLGVSSTAGTSHMQSQLLQWQAFGYSLDRLKEKAVHAIKQSTSLRNEAGGLFYEAFHNIIAGAVFTRLKEFDTALEFLERGLSISQTIPSTYLIITGLLNLSFLKYETEGPEAALDDLEAGLSLMKINGFSHFWTWEPEMMTKLLSCAVHRDIEKDFARSLARERLNINFSDEGDKLPLLKFTLLDSFEISAGGKVLFRAKDLTPFQRELMGLLVTAKGQRIPQEKIQLELWPESTPDNARKSFDTLLTRLRKQLNPQLPIPVKEYLYLQKGILCLTNYQIDAMEFIEIARTGLSHSKNSDWLQAHNAFQDALSLWKGSMPEDVFRSEQVLRYNDMMLGMLTEVGSVWAKSLAKSDRQEEAIVILEKILQINFLEESLTTLLYRLHLENQNPLKAREILSRYRTALVNADYEETEADSYIKDIIHATS